MAILFLLNVSPKKQKQMKIFLIHLEKYFFQLNKWNFESISVFCSLWAKAVVFVQIRVRDMHLNNSIVFDRTTRMRWSQITTWGFFRFFHPLFSRWIHKAEMKTLICCSFQLWPPVQIANFYFIPLHHRWVWRERLRDILDAATGWWRHVCATRLSYKRPGERERKKSRGVRSQDRLKHSRLVLRESQCDETNCRL